MSRSPGRLAFKYARAVFEELEDTQIRDAIETLSSLNNLLDNTHARSCLLDPTIPKSGILKVIRDVIGKLPEPVNRFIRLLVLRRRLFLVPDIELALRELERLSKNQIDVLVESAIDLTDEERQPIVDFVRKKTDREPNVRVAVDGSLIAGAVVSFDDYTLDLSIRGRLRRIRRGFEATDTSTEVV